MNDGGNLEQGDIKIQRHQRESIIHLSHDAAIHTLDISLAIQKAIEALQEKGKKEEQYYDDGSDEKSTYTQYAEAIKNSNNLDICLPGEYAPILWKVLSNFSRDLHIAELLLKAGANINFMNVRGEIFLSAGGNMSNLHNLKFMDFLFNHGIDIQLLNQYTNKNGKGILEYFAGLGHTFVEHMQYCIDRGIIYGQARAFAILANDYSNTMIKNHQHLGEISLDMANVFTTNGSKIFLQGIELTHETGHEILRQMIQRAKIVASQIQEK